ncbi:MAG TPA: tetratricopeptide repeat protein [bacterium]|nr:tetratricopeptide repeat protein [bacterium]
MTRSLKTLSAWTLTAGAFACAGSLWAGSAQDYDQAGLALFRAGQYEKAVQYFSNAVQADPNDAQAYEDMGNAYLKLGDKPNALNAYQSALKLKPGDTTLQALVDSLGGSGGGSEAGNGDVSASDSTDDSMQAPSYSPGTAPTTVIIEHHPLRRADVAPEPVYHDGLPFMDHARIWSSVSLGYAYSSMTDLMNGVDATNQAIQNDGYSGQATFDRSGVGLAFEVGFLLNPNSGIGLGVGWRRNSDLNENIDFNNGGDFQTINLQPQVYPLTLDYYLFLPDAGGRFYLSAGVGYYFGRIHVDNNFDFSVANGSPDYDEFTGDLAASAPGFQLAVGREFAVTPRIGISLFAKGYYAKLSNFQGTLVDPYGNAGQFGLAILSDGSVDVPNTSQIGGAGGARYATVDFTGFDVGFAVNFYHF